MGLEATAMVLARKNDLDGRDLQDIQKLKINSLGNLLGKYE